LDGQRALSITGTLIGLTVFRFFFFGRLGHTQMWNNHADSIPWIHMIVPIFFWMISFLGIAAIVVGYGLHRRASWARMTAIVFACFALLKFPFGTALGIYTLWVLAPAVSATQYDSIATLPSA
jgi:vacuolar-type H+-ATPase subunit I/STV1